MNGHPSFASPTPRLTHARVGVSVVLVGLVLVAGASGAADAATRSGLDTHAPSTTPPFVMDGDAPDTAASVGGTVASSATEPTPGSNSTADRTDRDTTVVWRGFRHVWSYNHRFNRFGSWVNTSLCNQDVCDYEVGHAGASGSGQDRASVRDAYTEVSAENVGFYADAVSLDITGTEKDPKNGGSDDRITVTRTVRIDRDRSVGDYGRYAVVLNGFDMKRVSGESAKVIDFEIATSKVTRERGDLVFNVTAVALLDCDSVECKGAAGKAVQDVDYNLRVQYLVVGGDSEAFAATRADAVEADYGWDACYDNKVENPVTQVQEDDDWAGNTFPENRMNCERSKELELQYDDYVKQPSMASAGSQYSVGTLGIKRLSVTAESEVHFTQYDTIVGGAYDGSRYRARALAFLKEWSSRPGQYGDARFSYGHDGGATVSVSPVLLEFRRACKRSFVNAGGIHWEGSGEDPTTSAATVTEDYRFAFGDQWKAGGGGPICKNRVEPPTVPTEPTAKPAFWVPGFAGFANPPIGPNESGKIVGSLWNEFGGGLEDPTKLRGRPGDRYYSEEQTNVPTDTADLRRFRDFDLKDDDGDRNVSRIEFQLEADLRYDDPADDTEFGDPHLTVRYRRTGGGWWTARTFTPPARDRISNPITLGPIFDNGETPPEGTFRHVQVTIREGSASGPILDRVETALPRPVRFETVANDRTIDAYIDSNPSGATLYVDGQRVGTTPVSGEIPAGEEGRQVEVEVVLEKDGYRTRRERLYLEEGRANSRTIDLYRPEETILVQSEPKAYVWVDGTRVGVTPLQHRLAPNESVDVVVEPLNTSYFNQTFENVTPPATINASPAESANLSVVFNYTKYIVNSSLPTVDPVYRSPNVTATVANASVPAEATVGRTAIFDATASYSLAGSIDSYRWRFGDGTTTTGAVVNHTYASAGTYRVSLTVTANGTTATTNETITVMDRPPRAAFSIVDPPVESGEIATFDASASVDPERNISVIHWQMGDGVRWTGERINHTYTAPGNYTVTVRVVDENGNADEINRTIRVYEPNDPPRAALSLSTTRATVGEPVTLDATGSRDPDGSIRRHVWKLPGGATAVGPTLNYAFSTRGRHDITLVVVDDDGERTTTTKTVIVQRATPTPTPTATPTETPTPTPADTREDERTSTDTPDTVESTDRPDESTSSTGRVDDSTTTASQGDRVFPLSGFGTLVSTLALLLALAGIATLTRRRR